MRNRADRFANNQGRRRNFGGWNLGWELSLSLPQYDGKFPGANPGQSQRLVDLADRWRRS